MKLKSLLALPLLFTVITLVGCQQKGYYTEENGTSVFHVQKDKYQLEVDKGDYGDYCKGLPSSKSYLEGTMLSFSIAYREGLPSVNAYLNNKRLEPTTIDNGFKQYEFRMPSCLSYLEIGEGLFGKETSLKEVVKDFSSFSEEDIKGVRVKIGTFRTSWDPEEFSPESDKYSEDARDIAYNYSIISLKQLRKATGMSYDYAPSYTVTYTLKDKKTIVLFFDNLCIECFNSDGSRYYYMFIDDAQLPKIQHPSNI